MIVIVVVIVIVVAARAVHVRGRRGGFGHARNLADVEAQWRKPTMR